MRSLKQKKTLGMTMVLVLAALAAGGLQVSRGADTNTPDLSGTTDASIREVITRVAHHQIHPLKDGDYPAVDTLDAAKAAAAPEGISWNYPWGVDLYGMLHMNDATHDKDAEQFVVQHDLIVARYYAWLEGLRQKLGNGADVKAFVGGKQVKIGGLIHLGNLDSCGAMGAQFMEAVLHHEDKPTPEEDLVGKTIADYILHKQARLPDGTFWRPTANGGTIWLDDLYMSCPFMLRWSQYTHDPKIIDDCARQVVNMAGRLQDTNGVFYHAYFENKKEHSPIKWGRANGWTMVATVEILSAMPDDHPDRTKLLDILRRHIEGIKPLQADSGLWRQILDDPDSWEETSCSAMFAYSIARAVNRGWIDPSNLAVARKAFAGVCRNVTPEGVVKGTCEGTNIGMDKNYYLKRHRPDDDLHGRGPTMLAGAELLLAGQK
jgi:unsaturated rhamnogalacturonyl hydrolase